MRYSGSSSQRGAPPRPAQQSPLPQPHPELPPEMEAEDSLELQLQQWSLARFAVAAVEHALPLIRTGESPLKPSFLFQTRLQLLPFASHVCFHRSSYSLFFFFFFPLIPAFSESLKVFQRVLELLAEAQGLLGDSVAPEVWDEHSLTATELASVFNSPPPRCRSTAMRLMSALVHTNTHLSPLRLTHSTYSEGQMVIVER